MNNPITNWSYDAPTEPGLYLSCYGDIETVENIACVEFNFCGSNLITKDGLRPMDYGSSFKWARLVVGSEARAMAEKIDD